MALEKGQSFVLGFDYGTDSCRAVLLDAATGEEAGVAVAAYPRWAKGLYCKPGENQFRQHPLDYIEVLEASAKGAVEKAGAAVAAKVRGIAIDTTGSTPAFVDAAGVPLALRPEFAENPAAMFVLWRDHTAVNEAEKINAACAANVKAGGINYAQYEGGIYSAEWFWAKAMRLFDEAPDVGDAAASMVEHCDWMTALLTGVTDIAKIKRSRCAMGHKAMWHASYPGGYPPADFIGGLDKRLLKILQSLPPQTYTSDLSAGALTPEWAARLGVPAGIPVAVGAYDAHMGAVGGGVREGSLVRVMGTSTCDVTVGKKGAGAEKLVGGICGQVDGSVIPGFIGYEAGQSSFGDVYAWFKRLCTWPLENILPNISVPGIDEAAKEKIAAELSKKIIPQLEKAADGIDPAQSGLIALDWFNGRRTPNANQRLTAAITGLALGSDAPRVYRALAEATAFGARASVDCFKSQGVAITEIIGIGGVARKSPLIMQIIADVLGMPISVAANDQTVALGAAILASVAAGLYPNVEAAQKALAAGIEKVYTPRADYVKKYDVLYAKYIALGITVEGK
jgi:L-ribulokinase